MATKPKYEHKEITNLCGKIEKDDNGKYIMIIPLDDETEKRVDMEQLLERFIGNYISFKQEVNIEYGT